MRGSVPFLALAILGALLLGGPLAAQPAKSAPSDQLQVDPGPFAEEIRQLEAAADKAARRDAFAAILKKAGDIKRVPEPLVSVLRNRKPEETFSELLAWIKETKEARVKSFLPPLIIIAGDSGEAARPATTALREYGLDALDTLCEMLSGKEAAERAAAVAVAAKRIGGARGVVRIIPHLVNLANQGPAEVQAGTIAALKKLALLELEKPDEWKAWLGQKSEQDLLAEINDREHEQNRLLREKLQDADRRLQQAELDNLVRNGATDPVALADRLRNSTYLGVQLKAAELLRALLPGLTDERAILPTDVLGETLLRAEKPDELRIACAAALAEAVAAPQVSPAKATRAFAFVDSLLQTNGISAELRLALLKALNSPVAAQRLAAVLKAEIDEVHTRGGAQLEVAIGQVAHVLAPKDKGANRDVLLGEITRLLDEITGKLAANNLPVPARKRYEDLAIKADDVLQYLARLREVDISPCVDVLLRLAKVEGAAAGSALTALRQAVGVASARETLRTRLTTPPASDALGDLYRRLSAGREDTLLVNLMGLYETLGVAPEPVEGLRAHLIEQAGTSPAKLPPTPDLRLSRRDAVRALLARLAGSDDAHVQMIKDLFKCTHGQKDVLGYIQVLPPPRAALVSLALRPELENDAVKVALLLHDISQALTATERDGEEHKSFRREAGDAARKAIAARVDSAITSGLDDDDRKDFQEYGEGALRQQFVAATVEKLREKSIVSDNRDAIADLLLAALRKAHPATYDKVALAKLEPREFEAAIDNLKVQLRKDGYSD